MISALTTFSIRGLCHAAIIGDHPAQNVRAIGLVSMAEKFGARGIAIGSITSAQKSQVHNTIYTTYIGVNLEKGNCY